MGPVTIFLMGNGKLININAAWGVVIFWLIVLVGVAISFLIMRNKDIGNWYRNVFLYGAYQLAKQVVLRSDEAMTGDSQWWASAFILWWGFSIKYFVPFAVWHLMMWNFSQDITPNAEGKFYNGYHLFWQLAGFVYPIIGLFCFFVPVCCPP